MNRMKEAIRLDCERLIDMFALNKANEFEVFCKEWKKMYFHHMYSGLRRDVEIILMTQNIFEVVSQILFDDETSNDWPHRKIGALYLIYAIYFKQPTERFVKFKLTLEMWKELRSFIESMQNDPSTIQVRYIFYKLISVNAFRFVVSETDYGIEDSFYFTKKREKHRSIWESVRNDVNQVNHPQSGLIESLSVLEGGYNEMKKLLNENTAKSGCSNSQPLEMTNLFADIQSSFQSISDLLKPTSNKAKEDDKGLSDESDAKYVKKERIEDRRKRIRKQAFKIDGNDEDESCDISLHGDIIQIAKDDDRCRLTNQTVSKIFSQELPEDTLNELNATEQTGVKAIVKTEMNEMDSSPGDKTTLALQCIKSERQFTE